MAQPFSFPPPPPPPPKTDVQSGPLQTYTHPHRGSLRGSGSHRGGSSQRQFGVRDRGRGFGRGVSRGSYVQSSSRQSYTDTRLSGHADDTSPQYSPPVTISHSPGGFKRDHSNAFGASSQIGNRPRAPPAVPSFNVDIERLLYKPSPESIRRQVAAPKKTNLLGLTPSQAEDESASDGEDDEAKLAPTTVENGITFSFKGQTTSLRTPEEIAAWLAERRKRYPTKVKVEAAKKEAEDKRRKWEEQKKQRAEVARVQRQEREEARRENEKDRLRKRLLAKVTADAKAAIASNKHDVAEAAKAKTEKLRKKAERAAQQLRDAEEAFRKANWERHKSQTGPIDEGLLSNASLADHAKVPHDSLESDLSSESSQGSEVDETSSSGSSDAETEHESDPAPEEFSSKREGPDRVPPGRNMSAASPEARLCRNLLKFGKCKFGKKCRYSHDRQRDSSKSSSKSSGSQAKRKGLYHIMVEKEQEEERRRALQAIIQLGEQGVLNDHQDVKESSQQPDNTAATGIS